GAGRPWGAHGPLASALCTSQEWQWWGPGLAALGCWIHGGRPPVDAVSRMRPPRARWRVTRLPWSRAVHAALQRRGRLGEATALAWMIRGAQGVLTYTRSAGMPPAHPPLTPRQGQGAA